jgi:S-adenosylmethionine/arginine decarboxylase-like enzyme
MVAEVPLGARMHTAGMVVKGALTPMSWVDLLNGVAKAIGMSAVAEPVTFTYPIDGKGGSGQTFFLPITESFLALDTWPDHAGAYLFVCSCRAFFTKDIDAEIVRHGLVVELRDDKRFYRELKLK